MTDQPFKSPAPYSSGSRNRVSEIEDHSMRMLWSLGCSVFCVVMVATMVTLVARHRPPPGLLINDNRIFFKVAIPLAATGFAAALSVAICIPVLISQNFRPCLWLLPLCAGLLWFVNVYNWSDLYMFGTMVFIDQWYLRTPSRFVIASLFSLGYFWVLALIAVCGEGYTSSADIQFQIDIARALADEKRQQRVGSSPTSDPS